MKNFAMFAIIVSSFCYSIIKSQTLFLHDSSLKDSLILHPKSLASRSDSLRTENKSLVYEPKFYTNSHLLFGAELIEPFEPQVFLSRVTRIWKTDVRLGLSQTITNRASAFFSLRSNDSPHTNNINLYEAGVNFKHNWGLLYFGQKRFSSGNNSWYLNESFDRSFWDQGLIYDFLIRSVGSVFDLGVSSVEFYIGADQSATAIVGANYFFDNLSGIKLKASALYVARDPVYAAFGSQFGVEISETNKNVSGYQVIGFKLFAQEPFPVHILTVFNEVRFHPVGKWEFGVAAFIKSIWIVSMVQDDFRSYISITYKSSVKFKPRLSLEYNKIQKFDEVHLTFSAPLNYSNDVKVVPLARYIFTKFGKGSLFLGVEGQICFGKWE